MRLGVMQPYFLPHLGYFSLISHCDRFILLDTVQFIRHGWIDRNRVLKPTDGWQYIGVPLVRHARSTLIKDVRIDDRVEWRRRLVAQLDHYRKRAPHHGEVVGWLEEHLQSETASIVALDAHLLRAACARLEIRTPIDVFSEIGLAIEPPAAPDEWALNICKAIGGVTEYWNPPGGRSFFDGEKYAASGIKLSFLAHRPVPYDQKRDRFVPGLSILDVMMFNGDKAVGAMLDNYDLL
jgi:hypothetical protein